MPDEKSELLFEKVINKTSDTGRVFGSVSIQTKVFNGHKFIQITQERAGYGNKPGRRGFITIDPADKEIKEALSQAYKF